MKYFKSQIEPLEEIIFAEVANGNSLKLDKKINSTWKTPDGKLFSTDWVLVPNLPVASLTSLAWLRAMGWRLDNRLPPDVPDKIYHKADDDLDLDQLHQMCFDHITVKNMNTKRLNNNLV